MNKRKMFGIFSVFLMILLTITPLTNGMNLEPKNCDIGVLEYAPGEVVVGFNDQLEVSAITEFNGCNIKNKIEELNIAVLEVSEGNEQTLIDSLSSDPLVDYAELNGIFHGYYEPNDPEWSEQGELRAIHCDVAWDMVWENGFNVKIAILDTGIDYNHEDLDKVYVSDGYDFVNDDSDPFDDSWGHGTFCAGIAAAKMDNHIGIAGAAGGFEENGEPRVTIMAEKVLKSDVTGKLEDVADGVVHAANNGANIISMSLGSKTGYTSLENACSYAYNRGVLLVAASGNDGASKVDFPARYNTVVAVGGMGYDNSNYGPDLELMAPGNYVYSTMPGNKYGSKSGTSVAAPQVAGVAALAMINNGKDNKKVRDLLRYYADDRGATGKDNEWGYGLLDARLGILGCDPQELDFGTVKKGSEVEAEIEVENHGDPALNPDLDWDLDWKIYHHPSWGQWTFSPDRGYDLKPDSSVKIKVTVIVPDVAGQEFGGYVSIRNDNRYDDGYKIPVTLQTSKSRQFSNSVFLRFLDNFPMLKNLFSTFLLLYNDM